MASNYSITLVVGSGFPGHSTIQINRPGFTTYIGMGPTGNLWPYTNPGRYDSITMLEGKSPVGALGNPREEFTYVDISKYTVKSYTFEITEQQALDAGNAALNYQRTYPFYNGFSATVCTDYTLSILKGAFPGINIESFSRVPSSLMTQLDQLSRSNGVLDVDLGGIVVHIRPGLPDIVPERLSPAWLA